MKFLIADAIHEALAPHLETVEQVLLFDELQETQLKKSHPHLNVNSDLYSSRYFKQFYQTANYLNSFFAQLIRTDLGSGDLVHHTKYGFSFVLSNELLKKNPEQGAKKIESVNLALFIQKLRSEGHQVDFQLRDPQQQDCVAQMLGDQIKEISSLSYVWKVLRGLKSATLFVLKRACITFLANIVDRKAKPKFDQMFLITNYPGNSTINAQEITDRHFGKFSNYLKDQKKAFQFLVSFDLPGTKALSLSAVKQTCTDIKGSGAEVLNQHLSFWDFVLCFLLGTGLTLKLFFLWPRIQKHKLFHFRGLNLSPLYAEGLMMGFLKPEFLDSILTSRSLAKFLSQAKSAQTLLSYYEFMSEGRYLTYLLKKNAIQHRMISIQHAQACVTKLPTTYEAREICDDAASASEKIHGPDLFLIHGDQYASILSKFYKHSKFKIVGCFKYSEFNKIKSNMSTGFRDFEKGSIGIFTSTEDYTELLELAHKLIKHFYLVYVKPHPANLLNPWYMKKVSDMGIQLVQDSSPYNLLKKVEYVISGYSSISIEATYFDKKVIRYFSYFQYPLFDEHEGIPVLRNFEQVVDWMKSNPLNNHQIEIFKRYFECLDGSQYSRALKCIDEFEKSESQV